MLRSQVTHPETYEAKTFRNRWEKKSCKKSEKKKCLPSIKSGLTSTPFGTYLRREYILVREYILNKIFVTRNKIFMTSKNKNIMTSLILEEMEKRGRRQVFRSEDMRLGLGFGHEIWIQIWAEIYPHIATENLGITLYRLF